jgi:16S rRNA (cytosine967-C5)-methyltransferase
MDVPEHAAVSETVEAAKDWPDARSGGAFLNAVLRRAAAERPDLDALPSPRSGRTGWPLPSRTASGVTAPPRLAAAQLGEPGIYLTAKASAAAVAEVTGGELLASGSVRAPGGPVEALGGVWQRRLVGAGPGRRPACKTAHGMRIGDPDKSGMIMDKSGMVMGKSSGNHGD